MPINIIQAEFSAPDPRNVPDTFQDQHGRMYHTQAKADKIANQKMVRDWRLVWGDAWPAARWGR